MQLIKNRKTFKGRFSTHFFVSPSSYLKSSVSVWTSCPVQKYSPGRWSLHSWWHLGTQSPPPPTSSLAIHRQKDGSVSTDSTEGGAAAHRARRRTGSRLAIAMAGWVGGCLDTDEKAVVKTQFDYGGVWETGKKGEGRLIAFLILIVLVSSLTAALCIINKSSQSPTDKLRPTTARCYSSA